MSFQLNPNLIKSHERGQLREKFLEKIIMSKELQYIHPALWETVSKVNHDKSNLILLSTTPRC